MVMKSVYVPPIEEPLIRVNKGAGMLGTYWKDIKAEMLKVAILSVGRKT